MRTIYHGQASTAPDWRWQAFVRLGAQRRRRDTNRRDHRNFGAPLVGQDAEFPLGSATTRPAQQAPSDADHAVLVSLETVLGERADTTV